MPADAFGGDDFLGGGVFDHVRGAGKIERLRLAEPIVVRRRLSDGRGSGGGGKRSKPTGDLSVTCLFHKPCTIGRG